MKCLFPYEHDIPTTMLDILPVFQKRWLDNGTIKKWDGPFKDIFSPVMERSPAGLAGRMIGRVPWMDENASRNALKLALKAFSNGRGEWPTMPIEERVERFESFLAGMIEARDRIVGLIQWEIGKSRQDAGEEFDRTVRYVRDCFNVFRQLPGRSSSLVTGNGVTGRLMRVPAGIALIMGPFNYPFFETMTAFIPAMLAGNTAIIKPPRLGCLFFEPLLDLFQRFFPAGSVNIIYGDGKTIVPVLMRSGSVSILYFIGTSTVAAYLKGCHPKQHRLKCILGLEAKNPAVVLPDADLDITVKESVRGALAFNGQRCAALKIFFVHRSIAGEFNERFRETLADLRCGMPWEDDVFITPLAEPARTGYLSGLIEDAKVQGAKVINEGGGDVCGSFFQPSILYPVAPGMRIYEEEQFGPIVPVVPFDDVEEFVRYVTESNYGQQASVFGKDRRALREMTRFLVHQVSRVNINSQCQRSPDTVPFTGRKDSAEGCLSIGKTVDAFTLPVFVAKKTGEVVDIPDELMG